DAICMGVGCAALSFQQTCGPARSGNAVSQRAFARGHPLAFGWGGRGGMLKYVCLGVTAAVCFAVAMAADAGDLSMTPIYQPRPSAAVPSSDSTKDQSRPGVPDGGRYQLSPGTGATAGTGRPPGGRLFWTGVYDRF